MNILSGSLERHWPALNRSKYSEKFPSFAPILKCLMKTCNPQNLTRGSDQPDCQHLIPVN
ncbi:MAG: hypothetical protein OXF20_10615 [Gammaproteobacteria bacterium]|nr:hypothetical protein [Gammaproteobacteria bacterium]